MSVKPTKIKDTLLEKYDDSTRAISNVIKKHRTNLTLLSIAQGISIYVVKVLTILYLVISVYRGNLSLGEFTALFYASLSLREQLDRFGSLITRMKNLNLYTKGIMDFFELDSTIENSNKGDSLGTEPLSLVFRNVSFRYNDDSDYVLKGLSFTIKAGEKVAIVGRNGVGKSTIAKLILRLYDSGEGNIYIGNKNIREIKIDDLRSRVGVAFQDSVLYAFNLRENINVYDPKVPESKLELVLQKVGLDSVLKKNNANTETALTRELEENGIELSGGERQMVGIARALSQDFGLLIFDEPSSSLDPMKENSLAKYIMHGTGNATVILISHRLSDVKDADKILYVENGQILESGTHRELIDLNGKYCELFKLQAEGYIDD